MIEYSESIYKGTNRNLSIYIEYFYYSFPVFLLISGFNKNDDKIDNMKIVKNEGFSREFYR